MASEDALADLDALLSDLERTQRELYEEEVLESSSTAASASTATSNSSFDACIQQKQLHNHRPIVHGSAPSSPTTTVNSAQKTPGHPIPSRHQKSARGEEALLGNTTFTTTAVVDQEDLEGSNMSAVANPVKQNINELDSLLQDLSNARFSEQHVEESSMSTTTKTTSSYMETRTEMSNQETSYVSMMNGSGPSVTSEKRSSQQQQSFTQESSTFGGPKMGRTPSPPARQYSTESREQRNLSSSSVSRYPASSATQELDDLMTSLNTLKVKEGPATEEPVSTTLDVMLGNLQVDFPKWGGGEPRSCKPEEQYFEDENEMFARPPCAGCGRAIYGRCITAMFRKFHPEHFVCSFCLKPLTKGIFKENGDKPYCHGCYYRLFG